jgi:pimeloyl-ACP methyl ester carboxylesterase
VVYESVLAEARRRGATQAVAELERIGPPPYGTSSGLRIQRIWAMRFEGTDVKFFLSLILLAPRYSLGDDLSWVRGVLASGDLLVGSDMKGPMTQVDFAAESLTFQVPIFVIHGTEDYWVPAELARAWVESLSAPAKEFIPMEGAGHFALMLHSDEFVRLMNDRLRPPTSVSE